VTWQGARGDAVRWGYALWRAVSGGGRRLLQPTFGQPVSSEWLRQHAYRAGQQGIDGIAWTWPLGTKAPMEKASRSSRDVGGGDETAAPALGGRDHRDGVRDVLCAPGAPDHPPVGVSYDDHQVTARLVTWLCCRRTVYVVPHTQGCARCR
jgi:hypothetical protein